MSYLRRWKNKYHNHVGQGLLSRLKNLLRYIISDCANLILLKTTRRRKDIHIQKSSRVLFIEPKKQGYGDLLFQTPIFEKLGKFTKLDIFCQEKHRCILINNPNIRHIYSSPEEINFKKYQYVIYLGRSTIRENIYARKCVNAIRLPLDDNLRVWVRAFDQNSHTRAWQIVVSQKTGIDDPFNQPKLFPDQTKKDRSIIIVGGVENSAKKIKNFNNIISYLCRIAKDLDYTLKVVGKTTESIHVPEGVNIVNLINISSYADTIQDINSADLVIGPEGSFIHVSSSLGIPTIVGEYGRSFLKYSEVKNNSTYIFKKLTTKNLESVVEKVIGRRK